MENLFDGLMGDGKIFISREVLRPTYVPENLPHRKKQIRGLADTLSPALKGDTF